GECSIFPIIVKVKVVVASHQITNVVILEHDNGQGEAAEAITSSIITSQTLQVDVIAGATYSSKVILKAVENALKP
ncbi:MAG: FMN-binding protein, partial [Bacilli bacterium]